MSRKLEKYDKIQEEKNAKKRAETAAKGAMTVAEAGKKGGETTKQRYGQGYYEAIGKRGGQRVRELIAKGRGEENAEE